jgi:mRNA interferase MazF
MVKPEVGQVVSTPFPFSDLTSKKYRPALIVAQADFGDIILCQITSKTYSSTNPVKLSRNDFEDGGLPISSYIRPDKLFTADISLISQIHGTITHQKLSEAHEAIRSLFTA